MNTGKFRVVYRLMDGTKCSLYRIENRPSGKGLNVTKEQLIKLIDANKIENCDYSMCNNEPQFRGINGTLLSELPEFDIRKNSFRNKRKDKNSYKYTLVARVVRKNILIGGVIQENNETRRQHNVTAKVLKELAGAEQIFNLTCTNEGTVLRYRNNTKNNIVTIRAGEN